MPFNQFCRGSNLILGDGYWLGRNKTSDLQLLPVLLSIPEIILGLLIEPTFRRSIKSNR